MGDVRIKWIQGISYDLMCVSKDLFYFLCMSDMASFFRFLSLLIKHTLKLSQIIHNFYSGIVALVGEKEKLLAIKGWSTTKWKLHKFLSCMFQNITHSSQSATAFLVFLRHVRYYCNLCMYCWFLGAFFSKEMRNLFYFKREE